jgi:hypothetical protein
MRPECEVEHPPPFIGEVKNEWSSTSVSPYDVMEWTEKTSSFTVSVHARSETDIYLSDRELTKQQ